MSRIRTAIKTTAISHAFALTGIILSAVTVPLYLTWLGAERYGILLTGLSFAGYLMFSDAGLSWASMLLISQAHGRGDKRTIQSILRTSFGLAVCSAMAVLLVVVAAYAAFTHSAGYLPSIFPRHSEFPGLALSIGASTILTLLLSPIYNLFVGLQEAHVTAVYQGTGRLIGTATAIGMAAAGAPLGWIFATNVAASLVVGIVAVVHCWKRHSWAFTREGPLWDPAQIRQQVRVGAKSFMMQIGGVLWGTAPVMAISSMAGPQFVPFFTIPLTLINTPLAIVSSLSSNLQAGYGEAIARGEVEWIATTVTRFLRNTIVILGLLGCGYLLLSPALIDLWTHGKITTSPQMLASVLIYAAMGSVLNVFRFALTGINRHKVAALSDLACGLLAIVLAHVAVKSFGPDFFGLGILAACLLTSVWIIPYSLRRALSSSQLWPTVGFWSRIGLVVLLTGSAGTAFSMLKLSSGAIFLSGGVVVVLTVYCLLIWKLLPEENQYLRSIVRTFRRKG
ncbi:lipopolysaccharide biosynthesis protein [Luteolibacter flavescens]|uniref:Lipopolysaccharide biosynthesis protein n=1 Tax=Luteolibacter flavescens TaxID=1859460 RepID=A0ABT3FUT4_9BACT|nr:lipopolysaccharide biosynthesis protein [Luteolibacter flavescens]MCW1887312.1 lipopolysaccharide biosynthesis protein [Luteolibacter flavescens]